jgi:hypothetical protein
LACREILEARRTILGMSASSTTPTSANADKIRIRGEHHQNSVPARLRIDELDSFFNKLPFFYHLVCQAQGISSSRKVYCELSVLSSAGATIGKPQRTKFASKSSNPTFDQDLYLCVTSPRLNMNQEEISLCDFVFVLILFFIL